MPSRVARWAITALRPSDQTMPDPRSQPIVALLSRTVGRAVETAVLPARSFLVRTTLSKIVVMRLRFWLILLMQAALVIGLLFGLRSGFMPAGIPGEWEWMRVPAWAKPAWEWLLLAAVAVIAYAAFAAWGLRVLGTGASRRTEPVWLGGLFVMAIAIQVIVPTGAPPGYDLTKWASVNYLPSSTGYFKVAREQAAGDPWKFLSEYPRWIRKSRLAAHRHPSAGPDRNPVFLASNHESEPGSGQGLARLDADVGRSRVSRLRCRRPSSAVAGRPCRALRDGAFDTPGLRRHRFSALPAGALGLAGKGRVGCGGALAACAGRQPVSTGRRHGLSFPLHLGPGALRLVHSTARRVKSSPPWRALPGRPIGLGDGIWHLLHHGVLAGGAHGRNHDRLDGRDRLANARPPDPGHGRGLFRPCLLPAVRPQASIRSLSACGTCIIMPGSTTNIPARIASGCWPTPIELASRWDCRRWCGVCVGLSSPTRVPASVWATLLVLVLVDLTGRNMGEVARLWMLFMPPLLAGAGSAYERLAPGRAPLAVGGSIALMGLQTLGLEAIIQVVYPV